MHWMFLPYLFIGIGFWVGASSARYYLYEGVGWWDCIRAMLFSILAWPLGVVTMVWVVRKERSE